MDRTAYIASIKAAYEGELYGEAWFAAMAREARAHDRQRKLATLARLEAQTAMRMAPLVRRLGITGIDESVQREKGIRLAQQHVGQSWPAFIAWFIDEIGGFVARYDELERNSAPEDAAILAELALHERALLEFARLEAQGMPDRSLEPVLALLDTRSSMSTS